MDDAARFAVIGEAFDKQRKTAEEIKALKLEALRLGSRLESLGKALKTNPECVVFDKQSFDGAINPMFSILPGDLDAERMKSLTDSLRSEMMSQRDTQAILDA